MGYLGLPTPRNNTKTVSRKNWVINGGFDIWQRGTSFPSASGGFHTADNWLLYGASASATISRQSFTVGQTDVPGNPTYYLNITKPAAQASGLNIRNPIESVVLSSGKTFTISFWYRNNHTVSRSFQVSFLQNFGTGGSAELAGIGAVSYNPPASSGWIYARQTVTMPSISGLTVGTASAGEYFAPLFQVGATQLQNLDISNVQVEEGLYATDFEPADPTMELMLCQRYYEEGLISTVSKNVSTGNYNGAPPIDTYYTVTKRAVPTVTYYTDSTKATTGLLLNNATLISPATSYFGSTYTNKFSTYGPGLTTVGDFASGYFTADASIY